MKKILVVAVGTVAIAVGGVAWLRAAQPAIGATAASPSYIVINTPTQVTLTAVITDPSLLPGGVNLLQTEASGKSLATVGVMHDDGLNGDSVAGDRTYSYRLTVNQTTIGQLYYRVSAAFKGVLLRSVSGVIGVHVDPSPLPPDPGEAGKVGLAGIDLDNDGLRDDVQRYIAITFASHPDYIAPASQYAKSVQGLLLASDSTSRTSSADAVVAGMRCMAFVLGVTDAYNDGKLLRQVILNTSIRQASYAQSEGTVSGRSFGAPHFSELKQFCAS